MEKETFIRAFGSTDADVSTFFPFLAEFLSDS